MFCFRSLVKAWEQAQSGKPLSPTMSYLSDKISHKQKWENSVDGIVKGFRRVAYGKVQSAVNSIRKYVRRGLAPEDAWNMSSVQLVAASEYTSISEADIRYLQETYEDHLGKIRPNAVGLVDAFDFRDQILNSTLGAYDGRVYERLMEEALKSPLNAEPVNQSFHKYLKPFMQGKL
ncbi:hypothetical protein HF086_013218 [Spodoptera exigua]|uniref:Acyl-CoA oxidase C-terminal domain-containing protein n=1 Tax=Spodoptera exigua TaxID=7107 RepID=A0A922SDB7_SPOEX|nr:hypothetical protein HF086_013218 [Spodoptera exigua]